MKEKNFLKQAWVKEPVRLRFKPLSKGGYSIYLDFYSNGRRWYEFLKMYLEPVVDEASQERNRQTLTEAELLRAQRAVELMRAERGLSTSEGRVRLSVFLDRLEHEYASQQRGHSRAAMLRCMHHHLEHHLGRRRMRTMMVGEVDEELCRSFANYLRHAVTQAGKPLSGVSAYHYFTCFRGVVGEMVRKGILTHNPMVKLKKLETVRRPMVTKGYLSADEVALLSRTPCRCESVKRAFLFSCMTGLRLSDIRRLRWGDIRKEGRCWRMGIVMQKTQEPIHSKLNDEAVGWLPRRGDSEEPVFQLPGNTTLNRVLSQWTAGIGKHVTFHTARHSYATMALEAGADLYVISKLLGHRSIKTTTVYAAVMDRQRDAAVDSVGRLLKRYSAGK